MEKCDFAIAQDLQGSCEKPQVAGLKNTGYIMNYDDIDWDNISQTGNIVDTLPLLAGKKAYKAYVPGKTPFTGTKTELATGTYRNKFTKTAPLIILNSGPDVSANIIDQLANGKFVFIFENKFQGEDGKNTFEIFGLEQGLTASEGSNDKYSEDTDGGWTVTLVEENAPTSGIFYFKTDPATSRSQLNSMLTATSGI